jgi:hypothetical protein
MIIPYKSNILFDAQYRELDINTIDKLCEINEDFEQFKVTEKYLNATDDYIDGTKREILEFCDKI